MAAAAALVLAVSPCVSAMPSEAPDETWGTNGRVNAIVQVGNTIYIGGSFSRVLEDGGAGPGTLARNNLAAFDATTGAPTDWAPNANDEVYALAASPDGKRIYAGGKFTSVNLSSRPRLAAIKAFGPGITESTWRAPFINSTVYALAFSGDKLYAGGTFTSVDGAPRKRLAAFSTTTATLDSAWAPAANGAVYSLALSSDGARVFAGGMFTTVSGRARQKAVALGAQAGGVISGWRPDPGHKVFALAVKDNTVYAGLGGDGNSIVAWDATTGAQRWRRFSDGDVQAVAVTGHVVYAGGHWNFFQGELRRKLVALDASTGAVRRDWAPKLPATQTTWYGVAALSASGSRVVAGGDFDSVSGFRQERYAQWTGSSNDTSPPDLSDRTAPVISRLALRPRAFRRRARIGYRLSEAATVRFQVQRPIAGRRIRGRCVPPPRRGRRGAGGRRSLRGRRCTRFVRVGRAFEQSGIPGANRRALTRRIGRRRLRRGANRRALTRRIGRGRLRRGAYRLVASATDAAGNRSARRLARFRVSGR